MARVRAGRFRHPVEDDLRAGRMLADLDRAA